MLASGFWHCQTFCSTCSLSATGTLRGPYGQLTTKFARRILALCNTGQRSIYVCHALPTLVLADPPTRGICTARAYSPKGDSDKSGETLWKHESIASGHGVKLP